MRARKRRLARRLDKFNYPDDLSQPMLRAGNVQYELSGRSVGTAYGGIGLMQQLVRELGLAEAIDQRLYLFKLHLPYHESDHVLNLAYNALCDGRCLEDLELRRQDEAYLNLLGAERIPDPTTAGDFCRRFSEQRPAAVAGGLSTPRDRRSGPGSRPSSSPKRGSMPTARWSAPTPSAKQGIDISYKGLWGYHPLVRHAGQHGRSAAADQPPRQPAQPRRSRRAVRRVHRAVPRRGLSEDPAPRRHRLLADAASRPLARAGGRAVRVRPGRHGSAAARRRRRPARIRPGNR